MHLILYFMTWSKQPEAAFESGADTHPLKARHKGSVSYTTQLEAEHPSYIHKLHRCAKKALGIQACCEDLAKCMSAWSRIAGEEWGSFFPEWVTYHTKLVTNPNFRGSNF